MQIIHRISALLTLTIISLVALLSFGASGASAASLNYTDHPMDDSTFRASFTMTATDIQNFLVSKNSGLVNFSDIEDCGSSAGSHYSFYATYYHCGTRQVAAQIIYDAAQAYGINPQAILATLQKEQSLITTPNPSASQLNYAMGYGCPDSGGCSFAGFFNQVDNGTWQFRTDFELSSGRNYWGYTPSSYPCNQATRYYNNPLLPGRDVIFVDDYGTGYARFVIPNASTATLYCYTPHVFPGSSQQYYSGSYWFVYYFSQWFGGTIAPFSFKSPSSGTVYIYVNGYKVAVPSMAMLQDYGVSPASIQTLSQAKVDAIPSPSLSADGISPTLSSIIKSSSDSDADGGSIYLVSVARKSGVTSMQQFSDFGFNVNNLAYLPLSFINAIDGNQNLSYYLQIPQSLVFQIANAQKRPIFDFQTFISRNPGGQTTPVSYSVISSFAPGNPLTNKELLIKPAGDSSIYLFTLSDRYYAFPSLNAYICWGSGAANLPLVQISDNSFISSISPIGALGCTIKNSSGTTYLMSKTIKYPIPSTYGSFASVVSNQDVVDAAGKIATSASPLKQAVKSPQDASIWYLENSGKKGIPSMSDFALLGLTSYDIVDASSLSTIQNLGIKMGTGQPVKTPDSSSVYVVSGDTRIAIGSSDDFTAHHYNWSNIDVIGSATLDQAYPYSGTVINRYFYDQASSASYLIDRYGCYSLNTSLLTSYGKDQSQMSASQAYNKSVFPGLNLSSCSQGSVYVKQVDQNTVYWIDAGVKHPVSSWSALQQKSGSSNPYIVNLSSTTLNQFSTGSTIN